MSDERSTRGRRPRGDRDRGRRQILIITFGLALSVGFFLLISRMDEGPLDILLPGLGARSALLEDDSFYARQTRVSPLSGIEERRLREQRALVEELSQRHIGTPITGGQSLDDLRVIQEILDKGVLKADQIYELQALGVALGDVLAAQHDLEWVSVEDEFGRSRALRYGDGEDLLFPVTMISKRVEGKLRFRVVDVYEKAVRTVEELALRAHGGRRQAL